MQRNLIGALMVSLSSVASVAIANDLRLIDAVKTQDTVVARALLARKVDVNTAQDDGATALHWVAYWDDLDMATLLIRAGAHVNAANVHSVTPLSLACTNASAAMVETLLNAGANPNAARQTGETPLMTCARTGNANAVNALLAAGADVQAKESSLGQTALMWAVAEQHLAVVRTLIDHGADVRARSNSGFTPLMFAARTGDLDTARLMLARGADVNETASDGSSVLTVATVRGHTALARFLLDQGADPNADGAGYTALHWAVGTWESATTHDYNADSGEWGALVGLRTGKLELVKALLTRGANPNARLRKNRSGPAFGGNSVFGGGSNVGASPFWLAALSGDVDVMRVLAANGADPLLATDDRTTPLMVAAGLAKAVEFTIVPADRHLEAVKLCLELGADINAANDAGNTALHGTAYIGFETIAEFLVQKGAYLDPKNKKGETPLSWAEGVEVIMQIVAQEKTAAVLRRLGARSR